MKTVVNQVLYVLRLRLMLQKRTAYSFAVSPYSRQHGFSAFAIINAFHSVCVMSWAILLL